MVNKLYKKLQDELIFNDLQIFINKEGIFIWKGVGSVNKRLLNKKHYKDTQLKEALEEILRV